MLAIKEWFLLLKNYKIICHQDFLQNLLFFLGYTKEDINNKDTNVLNWKHTKNLLSQENFFDKLEGYDFKGPKEGKVKPYAFVNRLLEKMKEDEEK